MKNLPCGGSNLAAVNYTSESKLVRVSRSSTDTFSFAPTSRRI